MKKHLVWLRNDLRIHDNNALFAACRDQNAEVYAVFTATEDQWQQHDMADIKKQFIYRNVQTLQKKLAALNIQLLFFNCGNFKTSAEKIAQLVQEHKFTHVFCNIEYPINENKRDEQCKQALTNIGCEFLRFHDFCIIPPTLYNKQGAPYKVFTPFKKAWLNQWLILPSKTLPTPNKRVATTTINCELLPELTIDANAKRWPAGEDHAQARLADFIDQGIASYHEHRDIPSKPGTSVLSPWLAIGALSPRFALEQAMAANNGTISAGCKGTQTWINELIWRDFYSHILDSFPHINYYKPFKLETDNIKWEDNPEHFEKWCNGETGTPIIDAAMKQLLKTGWMHNRLRMVVAMFLSKHLLIDWRRGEQFFMQHLIDGEFAANNGGWQWAASTGVDAVPYFRIFNPVTQSQRFDKDGIFIKHFLPQLEPLNSKQIHLPTAEQKQALGIDYPELIIDLKFGRERALSAFKAQQD